MTGLIFTQGRGIQLSAACLGHQPRLEQAGKAVQAGAGCRYGAGASRECQGATKALKPRQPKATAAVSHHTLNPPFPPRTQTLENCLVNCFCKINHGKIFLKSNPSLKFLS